MERYIKFDKFRNLGIDKKDVLMLNADFEVGKSGNLLILIGPNNSGKSNVLDGILKFQESSYVDQRDVTDLYFDEEYKRPSISFCYKDGNEYIEFEKRLKSKGEWKTTISSFEPPHITIERDPLLNDLQALKDIIINCGSDSTIIAQLIDKLRGSSNYDYEEIRYELFKTLAHYKGIFNQPGFNRIGLLRTFESETNEKLNLKEALENKYKFRLLPNVYSYQERQLSNGDLFTESISRIGEHRFFNSLFKILDIDVKSILNAYNQYSSDGNIAILKKLNKSVKSKVEKLDEQFNKTYFASNDKYTFSLDFGANRISFGLARGKNEDPIKLEYQSTGFRWFFNLFFNFLATNELDKGDIVIMDEPATNLHPQGQVELRKFIKDFAIRNDVLFIIATHSPFMIDIDNFDELRVVRMNDNKSEIDNVFATIDIDDPNSLLPIKESLTIKQHILYDLETEVYWVEGMTDYIYLTMFKNFLGLKNIAFLPFKGVGKNGEETKEILKRVYAVKLHKRSILVDADKAGMDMYNQAQKAGFDAVHNLSELTLSNGKKAKNIEDLFSSEDQKKYPFIKDKRSLALSEFKIHSKISDFTDETVSSFKKLFELLQD